MKTMRKVFAMLMALSMILALAITANAEGETTDDTTGGSSAAATGTITITPPTGSKGNNSYAIYKVFDGSGDGTNISYKLVDGKTTVPAGFAVDAAGNVSYTGSGTNGQLTEDDIAAIAAYVANDTPVATATSKDEAKATATGLADGYYYIATNTGTAVTIDSANHNAEVNDKNIVPEVDKTMTSAEGGTLDANGKNVVAQVGTDVGFKIEVKVTKGAEWYYVTDDMTGLTLNTDSFESTGLTAASAISKNNDKTWALTGGDFYVEPGDGNVGFTLYLSNDILTLEGEATEKIITFTYTAKIADSAVTKMGNTAILNYGDPSDPHSTPADGTDIDVRTATINVNKYTGEDKDATDKKLAGVKFVLMNTTKNGEENGPDYGKYYSYNATTKTITWTEVAEGAEIPESLKLTTDNNGAISFVGLGDGTYTLVETDPLPSYNAAPDQTITIAAGEVADTNLTQVADVQNQQGVELPSTGGIGTTIFTVVGATLMIGAAVLFITKKRSVN